MKSNASLKKIAGLLENAQSVLIFPHINVDGDALGSAAALCRVLRNMKKDAWILLEGEIPSYISFMDTEFCTEDTNCITQPDICLCVDCSEEGRIPKRADKYRTGKVRLCIDHHVTEDGFGDYYYIDGDEAATAQIIYKLILEMDADIDKTIAESIYIGISTDTGGFQYSNTSAKTHAIAAKLFEKGIDHTGIMVRLHQTVPLKTVRLQTEILERMEVLADGKAAISYVSKDMLQELSASLDDAEGSVDLLRNIEGVETAAFLKESDDSVRVSMRAKSFSDVHQIAVKFGGGGHAKAAGCTLRMPLKAAVEAVKQEIMAYWEKQGK